MNYWNGSEIDLTKSDDEESYNSNKRVVSGKKRKNSCGLNSNLVTPTKKARYMESPNEGGEHETKVIF